MVNHVCTVCARKAELLQARPAALCTAVVPRKAVLAASAASRMHASQSSRTDSRFEILR